MVKDSKEEFQAKEQELSKKLIPDILKIVQAIGEKEKYSMIIDVSADPSGLLREGERPDEAGDRGIQQDVQTQEVT